MTTLTALINDAEVVSESATSVFDFKLQDGGSWIMARYNSTDGSVEKRRNDSSDDWDAGVADETIAFVLQDFSTKKSVLTIPELEVKTVNGFGTKKFSNKTLNGPVDTMGELLPFTISSSSEDFKVYGGARTDAKISGSATHAVVLDDHGEVWQYGGVHNRSDLYKLGSESYYMHGDKTRHIREDGYLKNDHPDSEVSTIPGDQYLIDNSDVISIDNSTYQFPQELNFEDNTYIELEFDLYLDSSNTSDWSRICGIDTTYRLDALDIRMYRGSSATHKRDWGIYTYCKFGGSSYDRFFRGGNLNFDNDTWYSMRIVRHSPSSRTGDILEIFINDGSGYQKVNNLLGDTSEASGVGNNTTGVDLPARNDSRIQTWPPDGSSTLRLGWTDYKASFRNVRLTVMEPVATYVSADGTKTRAAYTEDDFHADFANGFHRPDPKNGMLHSAFALKKCKDVCALEGNTLALDVDGKMWAWGSNAYGLADGTSRGVLDSDLIMVAEYNGERSYSVDVDGERIIGWESDELFRMARIDMTTTDSWSVAEYRTVPVESKYRNTANYPGREVRYAGGLTRMEGPEMGATDGEGNFVKAIHLGKGDRVAELTLIPQLRYPDRLTQAWKYLNPSFVAFNFDFIGWEEKSTSSVFEKIEGTSVVPGMTIDLYDNPTKITIPKSAMSTNLEDFHKKTGMGLFQSSDFYRIDPAPTTFHPKGIPMGDGTIAYPGLSLSSFKDREIGIATGIKINNASQSFSVKVTINNEGEPRYCSIAAQGINWNYNNGGPRSDGTTDAAVAPSGRTRDRIFDDPREIPSESYNYNVSYKKLLNAGTNVIGPRILNEDWGTYPASGVMSSWADSHPLPTGSHSVQGFNPDRVSSAADSGTVFSFDPESTHLGIMIWLTQDISGSGNSGTAYIENIEITSNQPMYTEKVFGDYIIVNGVKKFLDDGWETSQQMPGTSPQTVFRRCDLSTRRVHVPHKIMADKTFMSVGADRNSLSDIACAVGTDGKVYLWGNMTSSKVIDAVASPRVATMCNGDLYVIDASNTLHVLASPNYAAVSKTIANARYVTHGDSEVLCVLLDGSVVNASTDAVDPDATSEIILYRGEESLTSDVVYFGVDDYLEVTPATKTLRLNGARELFATTNARDRANTYPSQKWTFTDFTAATGNSPFTDVAAANRLDDIGISTQPLFLEGDRAYNSVYDPKLDVGNWIKSSKTRANQRFYNQGVTVSDATSVDLVFERDHFRSPNDWWRQDQHFTFRIVRNYDVASFSSGYSLVWLAQWNKYDEDGEEASLMRSLFCGTSAENPEGAMGDHDFTEGRFFLEPTFSASLRARGLSDRRPAEWVDRVAVVRLGSDHVICYYKKGSFPAMDAYVSETPTGSNDNDPAPSNIGNNDWASDYNVTGDRWHSSTTSNPYTTTPKITLVTQTVNASDSTKVDLHIHFERAQLATSWITIGNDWVYLNDSTTAPASTVVDGKVTRTVTPGYSVTIDFARESGVLHDSVTVTPVLNAENLVLYTVGHYLEYDLSSRQRVSRVDIQATPTSDGTVIWNHVNPYQVAWVGSNDATSWTLIRERKFPNWRDSTSDAKDFFTVNTPITPFRYYRLHITQLSSNGTHVSVSRVKLTRPKDVDYSTFPVSNVEVAANDVLFKKEGYTITYDDLRVYDFVHDLHNTNLDVNLSMVNVRETGSALSERCLSFPIVAPNTDLGKVSASKTVRPYTKPTVTLDAGLLHVEHDSRFILMKNDGIAPTEENLSIAGAAPTVLTATVTSNDGRDASAVLAASGVFESRAAFHSSTLSHPSTAYTAFDSPGVSRTVSGEWLEFDLGAPTSLGDMVVTVPVASDGLSAEISEMDHFPSSLIVLARNAGDAEWVQLASANKTGWSAASFTMDLTQHTRTVTEVTSVQITLELKTQDKIYADSAGSIYVQVSSDGLNWIAPAAASVIHVPHYSHPDTTSATLFCDGIGRNASVTQTYTVSADTTHVRLINNGTVASDPSSLGDSAYIDYFKCNGVALDDGKMTLHADSRLGYSGNLDAARSNLHDFPIREFPVDLSSLTTATITATKYRYVRLVVTDVLAEDGYRIEFEDTGDSPPINLFDEYPLGPIGLSSSTPQYHLTWRLPPNPDPDTFRRSWNDPNDEYDPNGDILFSAQYVWVSFSTGFSGSGTTSWPNLPQFFRGGNYNPVNDLAAWDDLLPELNGPYETKYDMVMDLVAFTWRSHREEEEWMQITLEIPQMLKQVVLHPTSGSYKMPDYVIIEGSNDLNHYHARSGHNTPVESNSWVELTHVKGLRNKFTSGPQTIDIESPGFFLIYRIRVKGLSSDGVDHFDIQNLEFLCEPPAQNDDDWYTETKKENESMKIQNVTLNSYTEGSPSWFVEDSGAYRYVGPNIFDCEVELTGTSTATEAYNVTVPQGTTVRDVTYDGEHIRFELSNPVRFDNLVAFRENEQEQRNDSRSDFVNPEVPAGYSYSTYDSTRSRLWQDTQPKWTEDASRVQKDDVFLLCSSIKGKDLVMEGSVPNENFVVAVESVPENMSVDVLNSTGILLPTTSPLENDDRLEDLSITMGSQIVVNDGAEINVSGSKAAEMGSFSYTTQATTITEIDEPVYINFATSSYTGGSTITTLTEWKDRVGYVLGTNINPQLNSNQRKVPLFPLAMVLRTDLSGFIIVPGRNSSGDLNYNFWFFPFDSSQNFLANTEFTTYVKNYYTTNNRTTSLNRMEQELNHPGYDLYNNGTILRTHTDLSGNIMKHKEGSWDNRTAQEWIDYYDSISFYREEPFGTIYGTKKNWITGSSYSYNSEDLVYHTYFVKSTDSNAIWNDFASFISAYVSVPPNTGWTSSVPSVSFTHASAVGDRLFLGYLHPNDTLTMFSTKPLYSVPNLALGDRTFPIVDNPNNVFMGDSVFFDDSTTISAGIKKIYRDGDRLAIDYRVEDSGSITVAPTGFSFADTANLFTDPYAYTASGGFSWGNREWPSGLPAGQSSAAQTYIHTYSDGSSLTLNQPNYDPNGSSISVYFAKKANPGGSPYAIKNDQRDGNGIHFSPSFLSANTTYMFSVWVGIDSFTKGHRKCSICTPTVPP